MHGNQYLFGREERVFEEEHTESGGQLRSPHLLHSFILLLASSYCTCAYIQCLVQEICPDQQIYPFCTLLMSLWTTVVRNSKFDHIFVNLRRQLMYGTRLGCIWPLTFLLSYWKKCFYLDLPEFGGPAAVTGLWVNFTPLRLKVLLSIKLFLMRQT